MLAAAYALQLVVHVGRAVTHIADAENILGGHGWHRETEFTGLPLVDLPISTTAPVVMLGDSLLQHGAVGIEHFHGGTNQISVRTNILHVAIQLQLSDLPPLVVLYGDFPTVHLYFYGQPLAESLHGFGCREPRHMGLRTQVVEPVG